MGGWKEVKLGEIVNLAYGKGLVANKRNEGKIPVFSSAGITGHHNKPLVDSKGIIIGRKGSIGTIYKSEVPFYCIDTAYYILPNEGKYDFDFMYYLLQTLGLEKLNSDSAVPGLNRNAAYDQSFLLPPLPEQKAIAEVLSSLDDKIEMLHRQNKTLEQMAETLFRQWFIEEADESWEEACLEECVDIAIGRTPPRKQSQWFSTDEKDVKWISIKDMGSSGSFIFNTSEYLTKEAVEKFNIPLIPKDTVVLSFILTVGRVAITSDNMLSNEAIAHFKFHANTPFTKEYLYLFLKTYKYETLGSTSSIVTSINSKMIKKMLITIPDKKTIKTFNEYTQTFFQKIRTNQVQLYTLEKLRDTLLPKLMSGEIIVSNDLIN